MDIDKLIKEYEGRVDDWNYEEGFFAGTISLGVNQFETIQRCFITKIYKLKYGLNWLIEINNTFGKNLRWCQ